MDFGVGSGTSKTSGITSHCTVEVSMERHWQVCLLVLKTGPSQFVTDKRLIGAGVV